jgi:hypothetical protein
MGRGRPFLLEMDATLAAHEHGAALFHVDLQVFDLFVLDVTLGTKVT